MCSLQFNASFDTTLKEVKEEKSKITKKLIKMASEANVETEGLLDSLENHIKRMPQDLRHIRKARVGRHRVFFTGHHSQCSYLCFLLKPFKKTGVDDEDDAAFHTKLRAALSVNDVRTVDNTNIKVIAQSE